MLIAVGDVCLSVCLSRDRNGERESSHKQFHAEPWHSVSVLSVSASLYLSPPPPSPSNKPKPRVCPRHKHLRASPGPGGELGVCGHSTVLRQDVPAGPMKGVLPSWGSHPCGAGVCVPWRAVSRPGVLKKNKSHLRAVLPGAAFRVHCVLGGQSREEMKLPLCAWHSPPPGGPPQSSH